MFTPLETDKIVVRVSGGHDSPTFSDMCVIVISRDSDRRAITAVKSLADQNENAQIVLVNTGTGSLRSELGELLGRTLLLETPHPQYAGGARNIGIRMTRAPIVAFLAADCLATHGWLASRLQDHRQHRSVASALRPAPNESGLISLWSWACHLAVHHTRMPEVDAKSASFFGLSYDRSLFEEVGLFDESVRVGEDRLLNQKILQIETPHWNPSIVTLHRYPESLIAAVTDLFSRGRRQATQHLRLMEINRFQLAKRKLKFEIRTYHRMFLTTQMRRKYGFVVLLVAFGLAIVRCVGNLFPAESRIETPSGTGR